MKMLSGGNESKVYWFQIWQSAGCSSTNVCACEEFSRLQIDEKSKAVAWMTADQIGDLYKNETVKQAIVQKKASDPKSWKPHDEVPECPEAILYRIRLSETEVESLRKTHGQSLKIEAEMDDGAAARLATSYMSAQGPDGPVLGAGQAPPAIPGGGTAPNRSSEEAAALAAAEAAAAAASKALAEAAAAAKQRKQDDAQ